MSTYIINNSHYFCFVCEMFSVHNNVIIFIADLVVDQTAWQRQPACMHACDMRMRMRIVHVMDTPTVRPRPWPNRVRTYRLPVSAPCIKDNNLYCYHDECTL